MNTLFQKDNFKVRTVVKDSQVMFCARDVAVSLGYTDANHAYKSHCEAPILLSSGDLTDLDFSDPNPRGEYLSLPVERLGGLFNV